MDKAEELYDQVDDLLHQITLQTNQRVQTLELLQALEAQEGGLHQVGTTYPECVLPVVSARTPTIAAIFAFSYLCPSRLKCGYRRWAGQDWRNQGSPR